MLRKARRDILVVDADEDMLIALEWLLNGEGFHTTTAWSGREGLALLNSQPFDLALLDNHLPDLGPREIIKHLRRAGIFTPVLIMQDTEPTREEVSQSASSGIYCLVNKQKPQEIFEAVGKCLLPASDGGLRL